MITISHFSDMTYKATIASAEYLVTLDEANAIALVSVENAVGHIKDAPNGAYYASLFQPLFDEYFMQHAVDTAGTETPYNEE